MSSVVYVRRTLLRLIDSWSICMHDETGSAARMTAGSREFAVASAETLKPSP